MLVCDEHKWIFLRNPKTASRSVSKALVRNFNTRMVSNNHHHWEIPNGLAGYFVFSTVRNPYERAVSSWRHCNSWREISFDEFYKRIQSLSGWPNATNEVLKKSGRQWRIQSELLDLVNAEVHLLRYENLKEDLNSKLRRLEAVLHTRVGDRNLPIS